ncbi:hypothetical protein [Aquimarina sp. SS2-1]|uniref:hypothetical protein n=1 Tax=Aquimarina besae TaxID=3342247 RepID=UPI00366F1C88
MSAISGMNISMKNNNRRVKKKAFSHIRRESGTESQGIETESVSEKVLEEIRIKLKQQQKAGNRRNIIIGIISVFIFVLLFWVITYHYQNDPGVSFGPFR